MDPTEAVSLATDIAAPGKTARISLHLEDGSGLDRGSLQEVQVDAGRIADVKSCAQSFQLVASLLYWPSHQPRAQQSTASRSEHSACKCTRTCWRGRSAQTGLPTTAITPDAATAVCTKSIHKCRTAARGLGFPSRQFRKLEVTPVVVNGIMYVTSANDAFALDARTGRSRVASPAASELRLAG